MRIAVLKHEPDENLLVSGNGNYLYPDVGEKKCRPTPVGLLAYYQPRYFFFRNSI